jgi:FtsP/CotA-like multicopper oxidase with cupredoxin domain
VSRNQRIGLVVAAVAVAVVAFIVARPGDDEDSESATSTTPAQTEAETGADAEGEPAPPREPQVTRIRLRGGEVVGGAKTIEAEKGNTVRIVVGTDAPDALHLHGYDIERGAAPGNPAHFSFEANAEGEFVLESHTAEHAGKEPVVARLLVGPS